MRLYPSTSLEFMSLMDKEEFIRALKEKVYPIRLRWFSDEVGFEGNVLDRSFKITRITWRRNSFLPVIKGKLLPDGNGFRVIVKMRMVYYVAAFMLLWLTLIGSFTATSFSINDMSSFFMGMIMFAFGIGMSLGIFWYQVNKQKPLLETLFREIDPDIQVIV
jgi:hypothetical protein